MFTTFFDISTVIWLLYRDNIMTDVLSIDEVLPI